MAKPINIKLSLKNIGPFSNLEFNSDVSSLQVGYYANNGTGKTFISRMFRILTDQNISIDQELLNGYITFCKEKGDFNLEIASRDKAGNLTDSQKLSVKLKLDSIPEITNNTQYLFHVFNQDYVHENLEATGFLPNGEIEGYILGKSNIDLSKEKKEVNKLTTEISKKSEKLELEIDQAKSELLEIGVNSRTKELNLFTLVSVLGAEFPIDDSDYSSHLSSYYKMSSITDETSDIESFRPTPVLTLLDEIETVLKTPYNRSLLSEEFKEQLKNKQTFIEEGRKLIPSPKLKDACPYCSQELNESAIELINQYNLFLDDIEAKIFKKISQITMQLNEYMKQLYVRNNSEHAIFSNYNNLKSFFPSFSDTQLKDFPEVSDLKTHIDDLISLLEVKKNDISQPKEEYSEIISKIKKFLETREATIVINNNIIARINAAKNNIQHEKLELRRMLCRSRFHQLLINVSGIVDEYNQTFQNSIRLQKEIEEKESSIKISRRKKVAEDFKTFLDYFFGQKYDFDESNFSLKFQGQLLNNNASRVLSDGEKSIVGFCLYLAETNLIIRNSNDFNKLFFIIDDPISSLDFHFVYSVAELIRGINQRFKVTKNRFWIFTHNIEFMGILLRNRIVKDKFIIQDQEIVDLKEQLLLPYEHHLRDVYSVANQEPPPSHHIPNSIRHILETINNFESPNSNLRTYFNQYERLKRNDFLYALINDGSHGALRNQKPYTEQQIIDGCKIVIGHIEETYKGQITKLKKITS